MEEMDTEAFAMAPYTSWLPNQVPRRRSSGPVWRTSNSDVPICSLAPLHHGEVGAARPSSAEAFLPTGTDSAVSGDLLMRCAAWFLRRGIIETG